MTKTYKISNKEIVLTLKEVLAAMEVKNFNYFRIRAYQNVIPIIEGLTTSLYNLWENNRLDEVPGIGAGIKGQLNELFTTGKVMEFDVIRRDLPQGMFALIGLRGIGAKKAYKLATAFDLDDREHVYEIIKTAAEEGKIRELDGFGEKSEQMVLESISEIKKTKQEKPRLLLIQAEEIAARVISYLTRHPEIEEAVALGSLRRRSPTVGDLDIAIKTKNPEAALSHFAKFREIEEVLVEGDKRVSVVLANDIQVDIRICEEKYFGSMMQYFTGSKAHNIVLRTFALEKGCSLSEYGIKKIGKLNEFSREDDFYKFLGLPLIPPELRQGKHEVELAAGNKLPRLVEISQVKGDLHTHTIASDGINTLQEMVEAAVVLGYEYIGISDHAPSVQSRGYEETQEIIEDTRKKIDELNAAQDRIKVLYGYEVNILADAEISLPDELLKRLDYAIGSIHGAFNQDRETITKRLIAAAENPYINIIGHPSGRLINEREPCDINWRKLFAAVNANNKIIEINSQPNRLDLAEDLIPQATDRGIKLILSTDSHAVEQLNLLKYGIDTARRGWCLPENIVNTGSYDMMLRALETSSER